MLVNRIGWEANILYGAQRANGPGHDRDDGLDVHDLKEPPSMTAHELQHRFMRGLRSLVDIATNSKAIETLRNLQGRDRFMACSVMQQLEALAIDNQ